MSVRPPNELADDLDALLDGVPVEVDQELGPLVEAAAELRIELATLELDPAAAERHLARLLERSATVVPLPTAAQPPAPSWRRRVAALVLAAALVVVPATVASAAGGALPGQALYGVKLAIEDVRVAAVTWSPPREAGERTRIADVRLEELDQLVLIDAVERIPRAILALNRAVGAAQRAVQEAAGSAPPGRVRALQGRLDQVKRETFSKLAMVAGRLDHYPPSAARAISAAVIQTAPTVGDKLLQTIPPPATAPSSTTAATAAATAPPPPPSQATEPEPAATDQPAPPTTEAPPPPTTTEAPAPTTEPPTSDTTPPDSSSGQDAPQSGSDATAPTST